MPNFYVLTLSHKSVMTKVSTIMVQHGSDAIVKTETPLRDVEKMLISGLMDIAANNSKDVGDINIAIDLKSVLVNLPDSEDVVEIGDADRKNIEKAIELSVGKRPPVWFQCVSMWKQFQEWPKRTEVKTKSK